MSKTKRHLRTRRHFSGNRHSSISLPFITANLERESPWAVETDGLLTQLSVCSLMVWKKVDLLVKSKIWGQFYNVRLLIKNILC